MASLARLLLVSVTALGVATAGSAPAFASDYDPPIYVEDAPEYVPVEVGSGWYLRGDIGYNFKARHNSDTYTLGLVTHENNFRDALNIGFGFGYHVNDYFRLDVGLDRVFGSDFANRQLVAPTGPCIGYARVPDGFGGFTTIDPYGIANCLEEDRAAYNAWLLMANAYVDLGTYAGFTPFVGGGIGVGRVNWREETGSITCVPQSPDVQIEGCRAAGTPAQPAPNEIYTEPGLLNSGVDYRLAWSVSAGLSYALSNNLKLDTFYKYTRVGGASSPIVYNNTPGSSIANDGFDIHQVKVGLRYDLW